MSDTIIPNPLERRGSHQYCLFVSLSVYLSVFFFLNKFIIYLFLAELGLCCCMSAFSICGEWGLLFAAVCGLLIEVVLLLRSTGSRRAGFSSCGAWA